MSDTTATLPGEPKRGSILVASDRMRRRNRIEGIFRWLGLTAIVASLSVLALMLFTIFRDGSSAFFQAKLSFPVTLEAQVLDPAGNRSRDEMVKQTTVTYGKVLEGAFLAALAEKGIQTADIPEKDIRTMLSKAGPGELRARVLAEPGLLGQTIEVTVLAGGRIDGYLKGRVTMQSAERDGNVTTEQLVLADRLKDAGMLGLSWNWNFLTNPDASDQRPEAAGLGVAIIGSAFMMVLVLIMCVPVGVASSIYLEEFAPKNRFTDLIEVNIANLAAVPSIVYGILGLAIFINFAGFPQSSSLVGALVLSLQTLPTVIIATRASIRAVPPSIRDAALGVGASRMQTVFHHVLPLAMPGILTGTILGLASALGETAPLLLIGMVAFVSNHPSGPLDGGILDPATALPVQVYSWATRSDPAFIERSNGAIIVLLVFLLAMNVTAILLRRKFERRW
ncbi:phosphate ABC transporter permease PstA [Pseudogemmobacter humi]|uniref:Phosphate transport system permease protein PstA n=1 Tax=Pseudogemmobacter humi TaxID=2483812 RepID=A0A3P5XRX4_9RHOB|nr:phosphate ABC transporter permease PstA [Pseudogemmobacter humi]VDC30732.1 Phosphate transport system permease protein PstA [Pseudogemmobacter humi]